MPGPTEAALNLLQAPANAAAAGGLAVGIVTVVIPAVYDAVATRLARYSDADSRTLLKIGRHYATAYGGQIEPIMLEYSTAQQNRILGNNTQGNVDQDTIPYYFRFDPADRRLPRVYTDTSGQFIPEKDIALWALQLGDGHLRDAIEDCLAYILEFQLDSRGPVDRRTYAYDPVNLLFEELKMWLLFLSKKDTRDQSLLLLVNKRLSFIENLLHDRDLFQGITYWSNNVHASRPIFSALQDVHRILDKKIKPLLEDYQSRFSAREHFDQFQLCAKSTAKALSQFLYYLLRNTKVSPNFSMELIRFPDTSDYQRNKNTVLDRLLRFLLCSPEVVSVFPYTMGGGIHIPSSYGTGEYVDHVTLFDESSNPITYSYSRFLRLLADNSANAGILSDYSRDTAIISLFLKLCKHLKKLCLVQDIFKETASLAGEGGNILVYRFAKSIVQPLMEGMSVFFTELDGDIRAISTTIGAHFQRYQRDTNRGGYDTTLLVERWMASYEKTRVAVSVLRQLNENRITIISQINSAIARVNEESYTLDLQKRMNYLNDLVVKFSGVSPARPVIGAQAAGPAFFNARPAEPVIAAEAFFTQLIQPHIESDSPEGYHVAILLCKIKLEERFNAFLAEKLARLAVKKCCNVADKLDVLNYFEQLLLDQPLAASINNLHYLFAVLCFQIDPINNGPKSLDHLRRNQLLDTRAGNAFRDYISSYIARLAVIRADLDGYEAIMFPREAAVNIVAL